MNTALFIFGTHPVLSLSEIAHTLPADADRIVDVTREGLVYKLKNESEGLHDHPVPDLSRLGGIIKIAEVFDRMPLYEDPRLDLTVHIAEYLQTTATPGEELTFAISVYGDDAVNASNLCRFIKKELKERNLSQIRYVLPQEDSKSLSSAQVLHYGLTSQTTNTFEILIVKGTKQYFLARTTAVQDIESYVLRDEGRPSRRRDEGMMPIKLTQMLINIALPQRDFEKAPLVLDPFCGSGTILQEALRLGYDVVGTDINGNSIRSCQINLEWYTRKFMKNSPRSFQLFPLDARKLTSAFAPGSFDAIISEGYLGTLYSQAPTEAQLAKEIPALRDIYQKSLAAVYPILKPAGRIAIASPYYLRTRISIIRPLLDGLEKIGYNQPSLLPGIISPAWAKVTEDGTCIYHRPDQIVGREIVLLEKSTQRS
ncbi:hypothetical protein AUK40_00350 [Candidatus Wirthbacteria bacterium CG2_30_54_11]|uniref:Methyltransferase domain-containing protein n=1 Tax=Candidatus Wirthbacteria bacterium CG2_30_54_11 TaxID=1817892 RepID=A0A1J5IRX1_9BACT|nr:MAG: hypothetical protein AUK40_00350 [Candidatus Wirthbacteria bacterium CG2_30_54_11]